MGALPDGFQLVLDRSLRRFRDGTVLAGGHPGRVVTLTGDGATALDALVSGPDGPYGPGGAARATDPATAALAGRLIESGMAHPRRGDAGRSVDRSEPTDPALTVVVPVLARPDALDRCLAALGDRYPVVVVDDASLAPGPVAAVCAARGARLVRRDENGGPGAARNDGFAAVDTEFVAFVDSDCTTSPGWLDDLTWLFADPAIGAVAPRVIPTRAGDPRPRVIDRFHRAHSPLDLGPYEGEVGPRRAVRYVPTAALVVRTAAFADIGGFTPGMRVGEDVDLVWRLVDAGWRVRYQPEVTVDHVEPATWPGLLARRFRYGTSAGPLAERHPGRLAPVELRPWPTVAAVAALAGRPRTAAAAVAVSAVLLGRAVRPIGVPASQAWIWSAQGAGWTLVGLGRAATMLGAPGLAVLATRGRCGARAALALLLVPPVVEWARRRPDLDLPRWVAASVADDLAYGAGVWTGCIRAGSFGALLPATGRRPDES
jgi:mycofactocin system glycosyltransferase